jgi:CobQ-like glutamine amidotransferase family enzyme
MAKICLGNIQLSTAATTLSGYGITDAYTKTEVNNIVGNIETLLAAI